MQKLTRPEEEAKYFKYPAPVVDYSVKVEDGTWFIAWNSTNKPEGTSLKCQQRSRNPRSAYTFKYVGVNGYISPLYAEDGWIRLVFFFEDIDGNRSPEREEFFPLDENKIKEKQMDKWIAIDEYGEIPKGLYGKPEISVSDSPKDETQNDLRLENEKLKSQKETDDIFVRALKGEIKMLRDENKELREEIIGLKLHTPKVTAKPDPEAGKFTLETATTEGDVIDTHTDEAGRVYDKKTRQPLQGLHTETIKGKTHKFRVQTDIYEHLDLGDILSVRVELLDVRLNSLGVPLNTVAKMNELRSILMTAKYDNGVQVPGIFHDGEIVGSHDVDDLEGCLSVKQMFKLVPEGRTGKVELLIAGTLHPDEKNPYVPGKPWSPGHADWIESCELTIELPKPLAPVGKVEPVKTMLRRPPPELLKEVQNRRHHFRRVKDYVTATRWSHVEWLLLGAKSDLSEQDLRNWLDKAKRNNMQPALTTLPKVIAWLDERKKS